MEKKEFKEKIIRLIQTLSVSEEKKQELIQKANVAETFSELLGEVNTIIDDSVADFEVKANEKIKAIRQDLDKVVVQFQSEFAQIEKEAKQLEKAEAKKKDEQVLEETRKKLSSL